MSLDFDYQALRDELDAKPITGRGRNGTRGWVPTLEDDGHGIGLPADEPPEFDDGFDRWQDELVDMDPEDRALTGEIGTGYDRRCFGVGEL